MAGLVNVARGLGEFANGQQSRHTGQMTHSKLALLIGLSLLSNAALARPAQNETLQDGSQVTKVTGTVSVTCVSGCTGGAGGTVGQKTMAASSPVVIASDQTAFPVNAAQSGIWNTRLFDSGGTGITSQASGTQRALDIGINVAGVQVDPRTRTWTLASGTDSIAAIESGAWNITNISGTISLPTGAATSANQTSELTKLDTVHTDLTTTQPRKLQDGAGNAVTSQASGAQRALDVGVNVGGTQVDPRSIRALTSADVVTANAGSGNFTVVQPTGSNLNAVVSQPTAGNLNATVTVSGTAAVQDTSTGATAATAPTRAQLVGGVFNTTPATITTGQMGQLQLDATQNALVKINTALPAGTNVIGHVIADTGSTTAVTALPAIPTGANTIGNVGLIAGSAKVGQVAIDQTTPGTTNLVSIGTNGTVGITNAAAVAKGTQGANAVPTQALLDSGRSARTISLDGFAVAATTETLNTMSYSADNGTATTGTSYAVTTGKRLRVQQITASIHTITGNTTAATCIVRIRANNAGAALVSSPIQYVMALPGTAAANSSAGPIATQFPDGWEFIAGAGIGVTTTCPGFVATTAAPKVNISITGFEY